MKTPNPIPHFSTLHEIDALNERHVQYWCQRFQCSEAQLRAAVAVVGTDIDAVRKHATGHGYERPADR